MLRVPVDQIIPGMVLARPVPIPNDPHRFLLQRDREIPEDVIPRLKQIGILEVWVRHRQLEFLEDIIDVGLEEHQRELYWTVRRNFESIMNGAAGQLDFGRFQSSISDMFAFLKESSCGNMLLQKLDAYDCYLLSHSTNVCYLSLLLGMQLERYLIEQRSTRSPREAKDLRELGLGCILHDVGKMLVEPSILNKPGKLTPEEMDEIRKHPTFGYDMVKGRIPPVAAQVVLNHHQRFDGKGYPQRVDNLSGEPLPSLSGRQIPIFSRIATICDVYDAATTHRVYSAAKLPVQVMSEMRTWCRSMFDPVVEAAFYEIIPPFPIGQMVTLSNAAEAVVVDFNARFPTRPKVQCVRTPGGEEIRDPSAEEVDLAIYTDLQITAANERDVRNYVEILETADEEAVYV